MFKDYRTTDLKDFIDWSTKVQLLLEHHKYDIDFDAVSHTYDLQDLFNKGLRPRKAVDIIANEIFGLNDEG